MKNSKRSTPYTQYPQHLVDLFTSAAARRAFPSCAGRGATLVRVATDVLVHKENEKEDEIPALQPHTRENTMSCHVARFEQDWCATAAAVRTRV